MSNYILVTGGTGKTGRRTVEHLRTKGFSPRIGTRRPKKDAEVRFDWSDVSSFARAFKGANAVYLVAPTDTVDSLEAMRPGLEAALSAGVSRFVLLSASSLAEGGPMMGAVHAWLRQNAPEWVVLRPTWFMQNFSELHHRVPIRDDATIFTATGSGRIGFIDANDIAATAAAQLVASTVPNTDYILTGPEAISYDDGATTLSKHLRREVHHKNLSVDDLAARHRKMGFSAEYASTLAAMDAAISSGSEDRVTNNVLELSGKRPTSFDSFVHHSLAAWQSVASYLV